MTQARDLADGKFDTDTLVVDAANNRVGVGLTTPERVLHVNAGTNNNCALFESTDANADIYLQDNGATGNTSVGLRGQSNDLILITNGAEAARINSSGNLLLGTSSNIQSGQRLAVKYTYTNPGAAWESSSTATHNAIMFKNPNGTVGTIQTSGSSTAYNTSSDHRLKENVADMTGAIDRVKALAPKRFNFISDTTDTLVDGFLAHEAQTVVPEAVTGTHNGLETWSQREIDDGEAPDGTSAGDNKLDGDGNTIPEMQGIDQAKLVPLLTGALQEAITKIETLETEMTALKARVTALENA